MLCDVALKTATEPFSKIELQRTEKALVLGVRSVRITGIDLENLVWLLMLRNKYLGQVHANLLHLAHHAKLLLVAPLLERQLMLFYLQNNCFARSHKNKNEESDLRIILRIVCSTGETML
mmetsp:Transcript_51191/g.111231  ORF Transcript_51191/g.111231 Transcript_51191/m.111231 type:complete len:120 (+) Transcript_51191:516-875(+)